MNTTLELSQIREYLPLLIPLAVLQLSLMAWAVIHILRHDTYKCGNRVLWLLVSPCVSLVVPVLYFAVGKEEE